MSQQQQRRYAAIRSQIEEEKRAAGFRRWFARCGSIVSIDTENQKETYPNADMLYLKKTTLIRTDSGHVDMNLLTDEQIKKIILWQINN